MRAPPPSRADGGTDTRRAASPSQLRLSAILRAQRRRETVTEGGWAELPDEMVAKVLAKVLQAEEGGLGFTQASAMVRLVSAGWKAVHRRR